MLHISIAAIELHITAECYMYQLLQLNYEIGRKNPFFAKVCARQKLVHDNARSHVAKLLKGTLVMIGWEVLEHPAYTPYIV